MDIASMIGGDDDESGMQALGSIEESNACPSTNEPRKCARTAAMDSEAWSGTAEDERMDAIRGSDGGVC